MIVDNASKNKYNISEIFQIYWQRHDKEIKVFLTVKQLQLTIKIYTIVSKNSK